ncbi:MAG: AAA family ATPase, partial [Rhodospirillaceae bacterium]|nr:AAA family ATPase [Rhodospirillaceae bacterium]
MQFSKLRLTGFKSFVDPTELDIQPGLTGVVGPNGCGKSNLVEALKWVMGETSAKQMRGSEMDDVIFSGTRNRPARNIAEVGLALDNSDRGAPSQFNDNDELDVTRKIAREKGSTYRVNAKEVRARDVHLLFADAASGARSTALVSQGQIGEVVSAKPAQRRKLLEEAAGISGLHSRRHEAELRLRGAETNLERLDDIMVTLEAQMLSLRKQVRQATRYRNLNDHIRKAEAILFLIRWTAASLEMEQSSELLGEAEAAVTATTSVTSAASVAQAEAASNLPELREKEAEAAAALQRLNLAKESLEEEEARLAAAQEECETRLEQVTQDMERERNLAADANAAMRNLGEENERISAIEQDQEAAINEAGEKLASVRGEYEQQEQSLSELTERVAAQEAQRNDLARRRSELETRLTRLRASNEELTAEIAQLEEAAIDREAVAAMETKLSSAAETLEQARSQVESAEQARIEATRRLTETQAQSQTTMATAAKFEAEARALAELLETGDPDLWPPLIDAVTVESGLESALGTALGDDLSAATDEAAPVHWRNLPNNGDTPALPSGAEPLSNFVAGPAALVARLSQIGVVADSETGWRLLPQLKQGQRLVSRDGAFWRWDGFTSTADAPTSAAIRLEQRNRLAETRGSLESAQAAA